MEIVVGDGRLEVHLAAELPLRDELLEAGLVLGVLGAHHRQPHVDGLQGELQRLEHDAQVLRGALVAQVHERHGGAVGPAHHLGRVGAQVHRRGQHVHLLAGDAQPGDVLPRQLVADDHHVGVHQAEELLAPHPGEEAAVGLGLALEEGELDRGQGARVVDELVAEVRAALGQGVAAEGVEEVHQHVLFAVELPAHGAIEGLGPGGEIARAYRHPQEPGALVALDVRVVGRLHREHDDLVAVRQPLDVLRHATGDRRGGRDHVEAAQQQARQVAHGRARIMTR